MHTPLLRTLEWVESCFWVQSPQLRERDRERERKKERETSNHGNQSLRETQLSLEGLSTSFNLFSKHS